MPAVAVSSRVSDAVYLVAIVGLSILLAKPVYLVYAASQERGAEIVASGLAEMIDSMSPGTSVVTTLENYPGVRLTVALDETTVAASFGGGEARAHVNWQLTQLTLSPGHAYVFTLEGGRVVVAQARNG